MLSILCVTKAEPFATPFLQDMSALALSTMSELVIVADGNAASDVLKRIHWPGIVPMTPVVYSKGYLESVLDIALQRCTGSHVLRLDDDEKCSSALKDWLRTQQYVHQPIWKFSRAHLWQTADRVLLTPQLWPDHQTRLSLRALAGGRHFIHSGSPFGGGYEAPAVIEHHKFLVKSADERWAIARRYDTVHPGAGTGGMIAFQVPEHAYCNSDVWFGSLGEGRAHEISCSAVKQEGGLR
jgi:hypothetical protein